MDEASVDFKESIMKKVVSLKMKDTNELNLRVEMLKQDENKELDKLNQIYATLD